MAETNPLPAQVLLELHRAVSQWSDAQCKQAEAMMEKHKDLRTGRYPALSNAQLSGILSYLTSQDTWANQKQFVRHQREKAQKVERHELAAFWDDLEKAGEALVRQDAKALWAQVLQAAGKESKDLNPDKPPDIVHQLLLREHVQHLVAHALYLNTR